jgi:hypothetical protein
MKNKSQKLERRVLFLKKKYHRRGRSKSYSWRTCQRRGRGESYSWKYVGLSWGRGESYCNTEK